MRLHGHQPMKYDVMAQKINLKNHLDLSVFTWRRGLKATHLGHSEAYYIGMDRQRTGRYVPVWYSSLQGQGHISHP